MRQHAKLIIRKEKTSSKISAWVLKSRWKSKFIWGTYLGLPDLCAVKCDKKGKHRAIDGGLACYNCWTAKKRNGNSNPSRWIANSYCQLKKVEDRRTRKDITISDCKDVKNFMHFPKDRLTEDGLVSHNENKNMHECVKDYFGLNNKISNKK